MTIASLLLALITAANGPAASGADAPVLLDFHADWCGPCQQMRPVVKQFIRDGYPVKSVDIDRSSSVAERYDVRAVPTFIVVDGSGRELARTSGYQPVSDLERFYRAAALKAKPPQNSNAHTGDEEDADDRGAMDVRVEDRDDGIPVKRTGRRVDPGDQAQEPAPARAKAAALNPDPWETSVRIRVLARNSVGFGSGTVIYSTPRESLILTCAHIFKLDGRAKPVPPSQFPRDIKIDLFDGKLRGERPAQVHFLETVDGEAVDYDFVLDVGLIRIRPGRRLPASHVVPAYWKPDRNMGMTTVGCSEGQDATAWRTVIVNPRMPGSIIGSPSYEAIECRQAPKQGRSGGGLFTDNGFIAGVCNFAEPRGNHGLYATPTSIYRLLDRNQLASLYAPVPRDGGTLVADAPARSRPRASVRAQSPDPDAGEKVARQSANDELMIPDPSAIGVPELLAPTAERQPRKTNASTTARRIAWMPKPAEPARTSIPTDLSLDPAADHDHFGASIKPRAEAEPGVNAEDVASAPTEVGAPSTKPKWHAVRPAVVANGAESKVSE
jgi:thiol-disulfide isomerase/thioredoxin